MRLSLIHIFGDIALRAVLRIIGTVLDGALHRDLAALGQIAGAKFRRLPPGDDVEEIRLAHALLVGKAPLYGQDVYKRQERLNSACMLETLFK